jgi:hypothetical protein
MTPIRAAGKVLMNTVEDPFIMVSCDPTQVTVSLILAAGWPILYFLSVVELCELSHFAGSNASCPRIRPTEMEHVVLSGNAIIVNLP